MAIGEWIEWNGGDCPVEGHRRVEAHLRDGEIWEMDAESFDWGLSKDFPESDIIACRIVA